MQNSIIQNFEQSKELLSAAQTEIERKIIGQKDVIKLVLCSILSSGHTMIVGVPGLGKTLLVETIGEVMGLDTKRIQFAPDLMPADITGGEVLEEAETGEKTFRFIKGPIFSELLMADEINRASPRTQAALLQAMQERKVTVGGIDHKLPNAFHVLATRNPIEQEGTYPLPEAQLDRFMLEVDIGYPDFKSEKDILLATTGKENYDCKTIMNSSQLLGIQSLIRAMPIGDDMVNMILNIIRSLRPDDNADKEIADSIEWGPGPRAGQALMLCCRALALLDGRSAPNPDDIRSLLLPVLKHRMAFKFSAIADGVDIQQIASYAFEKASK